MLLESWPMGRSDCLQDHKAFTGYQRKQLGGTCMPVHVPVGRLASRLPAAWLLVHYPQVFVDPRIPSLGTDLLTAHKRCCWC